VPWKLRRHLWLGLLLASVLTVAACNDPKPIRIGVLGSLSGRHAELGLSGLNGAMIAIEEQNAAGGINGHPIQVVARDDTQDPAVAIRHLDEFAATAIEVAIGPTLSSVAVAITDHALAKNILLISPGAKTRKLTAIDDNIIRLLPDTSVNTESMARYLLTNQSARRVVIVRDRSNDEFTQNWTEDFTAYFVANGGEPPKEIIYDSGNKAHFVDLASLAVSAQADAIVLVAGHTDSAILCQHIRNLDKKVTIAVSEWAGSAKFIETGGRATEGVLVSQSINVDADNRDYVDFVARYRAQYHAAPGLVSLRGYEAARIAIQALRDRREGETVKAAILRIGTFPGLQNPILIDRFGDSSQDAFISVVADGKLKFLAR